ncbi:MAG: hypothetical protein QM817_23910 [Archangium sp.]
MTPTPLRAGVMDSQRPGLDVTLPVLRLSTGARVGRALVRLGIVSGIGLALVPVPLLHACGAITALIVGPIAAIFAFRGRAKVGAGNITCPKCSQPLPVPDALVGWPARFQCLQCKAMIELTPVPA